MKTREIARRLARLEQRQLVALSDAEHAKRSMEQASQAYAEEERASHTDAEWALFEEFDAWFKDFFGWEPNTYSLEELEDTNRVTRFNVGKVRLLLATFGSVMREEEGAWLSAHHPELIGQSYSRLCRAFSARIDAEVLDGEVPDRERRYFFDPDSWREHRFKPELNDPDFCAYSLRIIIAPTGDRRRRSLAFSKDWQRRDCAYRAMTEEEVYSMSPLEWVRTQPLLKKRRFRPNAA